MKPASKARNSERIEELLIKCDGLYIQEHAEAESLVL